MNRVEMTEELKVKLQAEAEEYAKSYEFGLDMQDMEYKLAREGKEIPSKEERIKMVKEQYMDIRRREMYCEKNGHSWKESNADPESGTSELDCECCGEHHTLQWL